MVIVENKLMLTNFINKNQFDLNAYLVYLFHNEDQLKSVK